MTHPILEMIKMSESGFVDDGIQVMGCKDCRSTTLIHGQVIHYDDCVVLMMYILMPRFFSMKRKDKQ